MDDDEAAPEPAVVEAAIKFVMGVFSRLDAAPPKAVVETYFGEVSVTWRSTDRTARIRSSRIARCGCVWRLV